MIELIVIDSNTLYGRLEEVGLEVEEFNKLYSFYSYIHPELETEEKISKILEFFEEN